MSDSSRFSILCVCTGNICRSPVAERLLANRLGPTVDVGSAGTFGVAGAPIADPMARRLRETGVDTADFSARRLDASASSVDLVLALTKAHRSATVEVAPALVRRTFTLLEFARLLERLGPNELPPGGAAVRLRAAIPVLATRRVPSATSDDIDDPIGRPDAVYGRVFTEIERAVDRITAIILPTA